MSRDPTSSTSIVWSCLAIRGVAACEIAAAAGLPRPGSASPTAASSSEAPSGRAPATNCSANASASRSSGSPGWLTAVAVSIAAGVSRACTVCATSCAISRRPSRSPGEYAPVRKNTSWPIANARAPTARAAASASGPVWIRTLSRSAPSTASSCARNFGSSGVPPRWARRTNSAASGWISSDSARRRTGVESAARIVIRATSAALGGTVGSNRGPGGAAFATAPRSPGGAPVGARRRASTATRVSRPGTPAVRATRSSDGHSRVLSSSTRVTLPTSGTSAPRRAT